jgi:hypothetical protein
VDRFRLRIEHETLRTPIRYRDPDNPGAGVQEFPFIRLATMVRVDPPPGSPSRIRPYPPTPAIIDTGAPISAIETATWEWLENAELIRHLPLEKSPTLSAGIGGHSTRYRLGCLWISLLDLQPGTPKSKDLPAVPVIVQLLLDRDCKLPYPIVLGLYQGVLDGRKLVREPTTLLPGSVPRFQQTDCGAWYGQEWYLETS